MSSEATSKILSSSSVSVVISSSMASVRRAGSAGGGGALGTALSFTSVSELGLLIASSIKPSFMEDDSSAIDSSAKVSWIASGEGAEPSSDGIS